MITTGTGVNFNGEYVKTLPPLDFFSSVTISSSASNNNNPDNSPEIESELGPDMSTLSSSLEQFASHTALALLKTSLATDQSLSPDVKLKHSLSSISGIRPLRYTSYDKEKSPGPPIDRNSKAKELAMQQSAIAMAGATATVNTNTNTPSVPTSTTPPVDLPAEALRKAAKMAAMAVKVAALQEKQRKDKERSQIIELDKSLTTE